MNARVLAAGLLLAFGLAVSSPVRAEDGLSGDDVELLDWFEGLDFQQPRGERFGEVVWYVPPDPDEPQLDEDGRPVEERRSVSWGFLVRDDDAAIVLYTLWMSEWSIKRSPPGRYEFEAHDLDEVLRDRAAGGDERAAPTKLLVLASLARSRGHDELAHRLIARAHAAAAERGRREHQGALRDWLIDDLSTLSIVYAKRALGGLDASREEVARAFRRVAEDFPDTEHAAEAASYADVLDRMVEEDRAHAESARPFDELSPEEQVEELIYQLRDYSRTRARSVRPPAGESPVARLVALGDAAVPQLIAHAENDGLTRAIDGWFNDYGYTVRIGQVCMRTLSQIAGETLDATRFGLGGHEPWVPRRARSVRAEAQAWWDEYQEVGERGLLIARLRRPHPTCHRTLARLREVDAEAAVVEGMAAYRRASGSDRTGLLHELAKMISDPRVTELFVVTARTDVLEGCRSRAATALLESGHPDGLALALARWQLFASGTRDFGWVTEVLRVLLEHGGPEGAAPVLSSFEGAGPELRERMLDAGTSYEPVVPQDEATRARLADLLGPLLDDPSQHGTDHRGRMLPGPRREGHERVCDVAAEWIAPLLTEGGSFGSYRTLAERDADIALLRAAWRASRGTSERDADEEPSRDR